MKRGPRPRAALTFGELARGYSIWALRAGRIQNRRWPWRGQQRRGRNDR